MSKHKPLYVAVTNGAWPEVVVKVFLDAGTDVGVGDEFDRTVFHAAVRRRDVWMTKWRL